MAREAVAPLRGVEFKQACLDYSRMWAARVGVRTEIETDHDTTPEVLEIYPPRCAVPHWFIWRNLAGAIVLDDNIVNETLEFSGITDIADALAVVEGELHDVSHGPEERG